MVRRNEKVGRFIYLYNALCTICLLLFYEYVFRAECKYAANESASLYDAITNHKTQRCSTIVIEYTKLIVAMKKVKQVLHHMIFSPQEGEHDPAIVKQFTLRRIPFVL